MSTTYTPSGALNIQGNAAVQASGDQAGQIRAAQAVAITYSAPGGMAPTISGYLAGTISPSTGTTYLLAAATAPFGAYSPGLVPNGLKVKEMWIQNLDPTNAVTVARAASDGLPFLSGASDGVVVQPGGLYLWTDPTGATIGALSTGVNDAMVVTPAAGSPSVFVVVKYGP
jgi:hypothetical protein